MSFTILKENEEEETSVSMAGCVRVEDHRNKDTDYWSRSKIFSFPSKEAYKAT